MKKYSTGNEQLDRITAYRLAKETGLSQTHAYRIVAGKVKKMTINTEIKVNKFFESVAEKVVNNSKINTYK